jgi:hypothetical protein
MSEKARNESRITKLVQRILNEVSPASGEGGAGRVEQVREISSLLALDYLSSLRNSFTRGEIKHLVGVASAIWPNFNRSPMGPPTMRLFTEVSEHLSVQFSSAPYRRRGGFAVRGFYLQRTPVPIGKPLIYVNSAHHPLAVGTAFCHEVGHHLSAGMFDSSANPPAARLYFEARCSGRLEDRVELAADIMVSLAGYPKPMARQIFSASVGKDFSMPPGALAGNAFDAVREHLRSRYGFDITAVLGPARKLNYLIGMVHYARLREALLTEYDL